MNGRRAQAHYNVWGCILCSVLLAAQAVSSAQALESLRVSLEQTGPDFYLPGQPVTLRVVLRSEGVGVLSSLRLTQTLPAGWTFLAAQPVSDQQRPSGPRDGDTGTIEFSWTPPARMPYEFLYIVQTPQEAREPQEIIAELSYATTNGGSGRAEAITRIEGPSDDGPVLTLLGDNPVQLLKGTPFVEPGFEATDAQDGDLQSAVQISGEVDVETPGRYTLTYLVRDADGHFARPQHRLVVITESLRERSPRAFATTTEQLPTLPDPAAAAVPSTFAPQPDSTLTLQAIPGEPTVTASSANPVVLESPAAPRVPVSWKALAGVGAASALALAAAIALWRYAYATPAWRKQKRTPPR